MKPLRYPKYFEVRCTEYTHNLFAAVLRNWRGSIKYFQLEKLNKQLRRWLSYNRIHLMALLCDILTITKRFQKLFESNSITVFDIDTKKTDYLNRMEHIKTGSIDKGWEEMFLQNIDDGAEGIYFFGNRLWKTNASDSTYDYRSPRRLDIINSLTRSIRERLAGDATFYERLQPLNIIDANTSSESLNLCHSFIASDLDQHEFCKQYYESANLLKHSECKNVHETLQQLNYISNEFEVLKTVLTRAAVMKPHSSDVERVISKTFLY